MRTKNLLIRKPECGFLRLTAVLLSFGLAFAGCDTGMAGPDISAMNADADNSAVAGLNAVSSDTKKIGVKFLICNNGIALKGSAGIVSTADDTYLASGKEAFADDYYITIPVPRADSYVNIRWQGTDSLSRKFWLKGKMPVKKAGKYVVSLDFSEEAETKAWDIDTQNLKEIYKYGPDSFVKHDWLPTDWDDALLRSFDAARNAPAGAYDTADRDDDEYAGVSGNLAAARPGTKKIKVKFEVENGGYGLTYSEGIVSTQDDSYLIHDWDFCANDYTITISVPENDKYLNIRWHCAEMFRGETYIKAKMKAESDIVTMSYRNVGSVATETLGRSLYDAEVNGIKGLDKEPEYSNWDFYKDWTEAERRAVSD